MTEHRTNPQSAIRNSQSEITFDNVSKFYGEILGVNRVSLAIPPGITSLVGPNGAGKTTLMNLMTGLLRPTRGRLSVLGIPTDQPEQLFRKVGFCSQFDSFPRGLTGREFIKSFLMVSGFASKEADELTTKALERVDLVAAADRRIGAYSKGMRQRVRLAQSIAHQPSVLIMDEDYLESYPARSGHDVGSRSAPEQRLRSGRGRDSRRARRDGCRAPDAGADSLRPAVALGGADVSRRQRGRGAPA